jgi:hypothetical protein
MNKVVTFPACPLLSSLAVMLWTFFAVPYVTHAAAWWGEGYKTPAWVLAHGGTLINYTIINGKADDYKGMLHQNGTYVEVEFGQNAQFDDAKNGYYTVTFYKCKKAVPLTDTTTKKKFVATIKKLPLLLCMRVPARPSTSSLMPMQKPQSLRHAVATYDQKHLPNVQLTLPRTSPASSAASRKTLRKRPVYLQKHTRQHKFFHNTLFFCDNSLHISTIHI